MTQNDANFDSTIYPDPYTFSPERWLVPDAERRRVGSYNFGRGTRSCIGMEVAYVELYLTLSRLFAPNAGIEFELHDTDYERDVRQWHDYFSPFPKSRNGIRVFVK
jgi:cytochrome P450